MNVDTQVYQAQVLCGSAFSADRIETTQIEMPLAPL